MQTEFKRVVVSKEIRKLLAFDRKVFTESDWFSAKEWQEYEPYWMTIAGATVGCCAFQRHVDFQQDIREDGVNPRLKGSLYISTTGILPEHQGSGIGRLFKCWQIANARYHGFHRIVTNTRKRNLPMIALNKEFGFRIIRTTPRYYSGPTDATVVMELLLGDKRGPRRQRKPR